jgi:ubiquinol oxidase
VEPAIARTCWILLADAMQCDDVLVVRAHEAHHRGVNHSFASEPAQDKPIELQMAAPPPWRADVTN